MLVAEVICFVLGAAWLSVAPVDAKGTTLGLALAIQYGVTPFLLGDLLKTLLAVALLTAFRRTLPAK
jgi:biotin transport system substrate-specific component